VPGPDPEIPVDPSGRLVIDPDDPVLAALAPDVNLPPLQVHVAPVWVIRVVPDPSQLGQPDTGRPEHREDGRVAPLRERVPLARLLQLGKFYAGE